MRAYEHRGRKENEVMNVLHGHPGSPVEGILQGQIGQESKLKIAQSRKCDACRESGRRKRFHETATVVTLSCVRLLGTQFYPSGKHGSGRRPIDNVNERNFAAGNLRESTSNRLPGRIFQNIFN